MSMQRCAGVLRELRCFLRHLQDFAAVLRLLLPGKGLFTQELSHKAQGVHFFLETLQFSFFAAKYFLGIFHFDSGGYLGRLPLTRIYGGTAKRKTSPEYTSRISVLVPQMVRMSLQDGEPTIELFQQKHTRQFMGYGHLP